MNVIRYARVHQRDPGIPGRAGEPELEPLAPEDLLDRLAALEPGPDDPPEAARLEFARWKPGHAITAGYLVQMASGREDGVVWRRYRDGKARRLARVSPADRRMQEAVRFGRAFAADPERDEVLWAHPADRQLPGLARLHRRLRLQRLVQDAGFGAGKVLRRRGQPPQLLRYKPERRAVLRVGMRWRDEAGVHLPGEDLALARVLPPKVAAGVARLRGRLGDAVPLPRLLAHEARTGILLEEWLDVEDPHPGRADHAGEAGALLAALHRAPGAESLPAIGHTPASQLRPFLRAVPGGGEAASLCEPPPAGDARGWLHGDFHPQQVARSRADGRPVLLDLDGIGGGTPVMDLASWIGDVIAWHPEASWDEAVGGLLEGYAGGGGRVPDRDALRAWVAHELVHRAAGHLRRLEMDGVAKAEWLLQRAREMAAAGSATR